MSNGDWGLGPIPNPHFCNKKQLITFIKLFLLINNIKMPNNKKNE